MMHRPVSTEALKVAEDVAVTRSSTTHSVADVAPRCDELVTEEDTLHQVQPAAKTRHTSHLEKIVVFC